MKLYAASGLPVRDALAKAHEDTLASFATPGQWFDGHERTALVEEARQARRTAGLDDSPAPPAPLSTAVHETARRVARQVAEHVAPEITGHSHNEMDVIGHDSESKNEPLSMVSGFMKLM